MDGLKIAKAIRERRNQKGFSQRKVAEMISTGEPGLLSKAELRAAAKAKGVVGYRKMRVSELESALGISEYSQTFVSYIESGSRRPSVDTLERFAAALDLRFIIGPEGTDVEEL